MPYALSIVNKVFITRARNFLHHLMANPIYAANCIYVSLNTSGQNELRIKKQMRSIK